ncbi:MAG: GntR family transcriptional regulator [Coleofasciculaceae cyanobacterium SM2_3_26]|nr:GntR family transcriptional regulator [Coleofasciculaceae cyanobacterium SM2_3_26]
MRSIQRPKSLHEETYCSLRESILAGELLPGKRLVETHLAEALQVSRTPIREALRQLEREALIVRDDRGGMRVVTISPVDAVQLYDCRLALEQLSVRTACEAITPDWLREIESATLRAENLIADAIAADSSPPQVADMLALDRAFHCAIASGSGNPWLAHLLDGVFDKMHLLRIQTTTYNPRVLDISREHRCIYEAIARQDADAAVGAIETHLTASKQRVVRELEKLHQQGA